MATPETVGEYYNNWSSQYASAYGDIIQAYRTTNTHALLSYIQDSMGLAPEMKLLDAGCGVGGPSLYFAKNMNLQIDAVTVSSQQVTQAERKVQANGLTKQIRVHLGDYHFMHHQFEHESFDGVYFLESLGHSNNIQAAVNASWHVLKYEGFIYIKDFFFKQTANEEFNQRVQTVVKKVNEDYCYNVMSLDELIKHLRLCGFVIEFIRPPKFTDDTSVRKAFETANGIDTFQGKPEFYYAEWLEIKCIKFRN